jgi:hypothetical protein
MSNVTKIRRRDSELPSRKVLEKRLEEQRQLLMRARGIIGMAEQYADGLMMQSNADKSADLWAALKAAWELIDKAWSATDSVPFFQPESEREGAA